MHFGPILLETTGGTCLSQVMIAISTFREWVLSGGGVGGASF